MTARPQVTKEELPLATDKEIASVVSRFEKCTLPYKHWTHRAHLCVAVSYLRKLPFKEAHARMRQNINRYNKACGDPAGYNETITVLFLKKIAHDMANETNFPGLHQEISRLAEAWSVEWLYRYYSKELIWSEAAKSAWTKPDVAPLDF